MQRIQIVRFGGALRSENVGMSNHKPGESPGHRKPEVSLAMTISQGLGGPKGKPKGVLDGQPVNIPALPRMSLKLTESSSPDALLDLRYSTKIFQGWIKCFVSTRQIRMSRFPRKFFRSYCAWDPYRKPTQVGWRKSAKVNE